MEDHQGIFSGGAVYVYSGLDMSLLDWDYGKEVAEYLGKSVHGGGDVNGDGLPDVIISNNEDANGIHDSGSVFVYVAKSLQATDEVPIGGELTLDLRVPAQPTGFYFLGFSLGSDPGIPVGTRTLPLNWDLLFAVTFGNPAFAGNLDADGEKQIVLFVPNDPSLSGLLIYSAFLTLKAGAPKGVGTISNPEEILLQ